MKIILSPAKKMVSDTDSLAPVNVPKHMDQTAAILSFMKSQSEEELKAVWKCNDKIAEQNFHRLETMDLYRGLTPAVLSYEGIAFQYMAPATPSTSNFNAPSAFSSSMAALPSSAARCFWMPPNCLPYLGPTVRS